MILEADRRSRVRRVAEERLAAFVRYRKLMEDQEAALENGDLERYRRLESRRTEVEEGGMLDVSALDEIGRVPEEVLEELRSEVSRALEGQRRIERKLHEIRDETRRELRSLPRNVARSRRYVAARSEGEGRGVELDVQL